MKHKLGIAVLQTDLVWEDAGANQARVEEMLAQLPDTVDLVVLAEMFTTGFSMAPARTATPAGGDVMKWFQGLSADKAYAICGSIAVEEGGKYYNRFLWSEAGSIRAQYDKKHLFTMAGEHEVYTPGSTSAGIDFKGWSILPRVCYDLRFPVWCRSTDADLQIYVANWPEPRVKAWDTLLKARAIENQCYVVGANRVGLDANGNIYVGHSAVIDAKGLPITPENNKTEGWIFAELDKEVLSDFRERFPFYRDADSFSLDQSDG